MAQRLLFDVLPQGRWSESFSALWRSALRPAGLFDPEIRSLTKVPPERLAKLSAATGRWLGYLQHCGLETDPFDALDQYDVVSGFMRQLTAVAPCTQRGYVTDLREAIYTLAPSGRTFPLLDRAFRWLWRTAEPIIEKASQLVPARDLFDLGFELMDGARERRTPLQEAEQFRDGLMVAVLIASVVRLKNFAAIDTGDNLIERGGRYHLFFPPKDVKTKRPLDIVLPVELTKPIGRWLSDYRQELLTRRGRWFHEQPGSKLWISQSGSPYISGKQISARIVSVTRARFGKRITPHFFRDVAATSIAIELSKEVGIIRPVLGHTSAKTGERYYNWASSWSAGTAYQQSLARLAIADHPRSTNEGGL